MTIHPTWALAALLGGACRPDEPAGHTGRHTGSAEHTGAGDLLPPPTARELAEGDVLVVPEKQGLTFLRADGSRAWSDTWTAVVGDCAACGGEGASADGDGLLLSFTTEGPTRGGAVARLAADGALDWRVDGFAFPHDAVRDPFDDTVIVPEVGGSRLTWIPGDGTSAEPVRVLEPGMPDWPAKLPNGAERFDFDGRRYLLVSHRGLPTLPTRTGGSPVPTGLLSLWDLTDGAPALVWRFPEAGGLDTPHGAVFRVHEGRWWLLYAHTRGAAVGGSVGVAVTDDPTQLPAYVADLVPTGAAAPFDFLRGVDLSADGTLWLVDSGPGNGVGTREPTGRMLSAPLPDLPAPAGATGVVDTDQVLVDLRPTVLTEGLGNPFEGWWWRPPWPLPGS
jgi:hypothetical protein